jgi:hypothetical protein
MTQCKRNQLNPTTLPRENVQNMVGFSRFGPTPKYPNISARFGRFLWIGWLDWADSFCIESDVMRHKFRLPTWGIFETTIFRLFWHYTPFEGTWKNIFRWKKYFPNSPYIIGNLMRYLRNWNITKRGEWDTLMNDPYLSTWVKAEH